MKELELKSEDKIEIVKQQQKKDILVLQNKIQPNKNHFIFEFNLKTLNLCLAKYNPIRTDLHWHEALMLYSKKAFKKISIENADTITKASIIKNPNCVYFASLNEFNAKKHIKKNYNIYL